jgi:restriction endonuclease Mrr
VIKASMSNSRLMMLTAATALAVQVKTSSRPVGVTDVQSIAGAALRGGFDRWLFVSRSGFTEQAKEFASAVGLIKLELLSPTELRRWITKFNCSGTAEASKLELIIRTAMKEVAKHLALCPADLHRVEWRDLERLLREAFEGIGFDTVLTRSTKDGGFDLRLTFQEHGRKTTHLVEVKHWSAPFRPGSAVLQHFAHVVAREAAEGGLLLSTSGFAETAAEGLTESEQRLLRLGNDTKNHFALQDLLQTG